MARRIALSKLNASTIDILNTIRANAGAEYQSMVPEVTTALQIPKVGDILYGYPNLADRFVSQLMNRIALVRVRSATFYNDYQELKKGYLEFGETVEEVFVQITKAQYFDVEKAEKRELKRYLPDVRAAFHVMNWRVQYPITIQDEDLRTAFTSMDGVQDLIARIVDAIYTANEYDEFLLFKYLMIKAISHGKMYPVAFNPNDIKTGAVSFRGYSNLMRFMGTDYNAEGVLNNTPIEDQYIFMDAMFNAQYDVDVLSAAFNMSKADYTGKLKLIDNWTTFDWARFEEIAAESDCIEPITAEELALMANVKAVLIDREWFQVYDNLTRFTEKYAASGMYWNYFYNVWKTVSSSPFSNAIVFVAEATAPALPTTITFSIDGKEIAETGTIFTLELDEDTAALIGGNPQFVQGETETKNAIAVHKYGAYIFPPSASAISVYPEIEVNGTTYYAQTALTTASTVDTEIQFKTTKPTPPTPGTDTETVSTTKTSK